MICIRNRLHPFHHQHLPFSDFNFLIYISRLWWISKFFVLFLLFLTVDLIKLWNGFLFKIKYKPWLTKHTHTESTIWYAWEKLNFEKYGLLLAVDCNTVSVFVCSSSSSPSVVGLIEILDLRFQIALNKREIPFLRSLGRNFALPLFDDVLCFWIDFNFEFLFHDCRLFEGNEQLLDLFTKFSRLRTKDAQRQSEELAEHATNVLGKFTLVYDVISFKLDFDLASDRKFDRLMISCCCSPLFVLLFSLSLSFLF